MILRLGLNPAVLASRPILDAVVHANPLLVLCRRCCPFRLRPSKTRGTYGVGQRFWSWDCGNLSRGAPFRCERLNCPGEAYMNRSRALLLAPLALASAMSTAAHAQRRLDLATFFVGFPPGGATDTVARLVADAVQGNYAETVVVQDRP